MTEQMVHQIYEIDSYREAIQQVRLLKPDCLIYGDVLSQVMTLGGCHHLIWECLGESAVMVVKMVEIVNV